MAQFDTSFRAMNTDIDVLIEAPMPPIDAFIGVRMLFEAQEAMFSRFLPESLLSRLNRGETVTDARFAAAVRLAFEANEFTGGLFNPMVLPALAEAGYDRSFEGVGGGQPRGQEVPEPKECLRVSGDSVELVRGALDLGGIVKGWTVDLAVEQLSRQHEDVFVNAGGDLRCAGSEEGGDGWCVGVDGPDGGSAWEGWMRGALATSTIAKRRWAAQDGSNAHHLIDPATGMPATQGFVQASGWSDETWWAECWAKAVVIGGVAAATRAAEAGIRVLAIGQTGRSEWFGPG